MPTCPRFYQCSAPVCPLDPDRHKRVHLPGDRICTLAAELVKPGAAARLANILEPKLLARVSEAIPALMSSGAPLRSALARAASTGSKLDSAARMRAQPIGGVA
jgi:hypothetical protein